MSDPGFSITGEERQVPAAMRIGRRLYQNFVGSQVWTAIQRSDRQRKTFAKKIEATEDNVREILHKVAVEVFDFERCIQGLEAKMIDARLGEDLEGLRILYRKMFDILKAEEIRIEDPTGNILDDELRKKVEVQSYIRRDSVEQETIERTVAPIVSHNGKLIKPGIVIVSTPCKQQEDQSNGASEDRGH